MTAFFDSDVLLCFLDRREPEKWKIARDLFDEHTATETLVVSAQVLGEIFNVLSKKWKMPKTEAILQVGLFAKFPTVAIDETLVAAAMERSRRSMISCYDALVVEAARRGGADVIYSEDMHHGMDFGGVRLVNPFVA